MVSSVQQTPEDDFDQYFSDFNNDNNQLCADAKAVQDAIAKEKADEAAFREKLLNGLSSNPQIALMQLFYILGGSSQDSTMIGIWNEQSGITGARLKLNGDITKMGNDLSNMVNSNSGNPDQTIMFGNCLVKACDEFYGTGPDKVQRKYYNHDLDPTIANPSMDPSTESSLYTELSGMRALFNLTSGTYAQPEETNWYNPGTGDTYYFANAGGNYISCFAQLQGDLSQQGDPQSATEAMKNITDAFNTDTSTTQTASAVLQNDEKTYSGVTQSGQSCLSAIAQYWNGTVKTVNSHLASGS